MRVISCMECSTDNSLVSIVFDNGLSRIFKLERVEEKLKKEEFYQNLDRDSKITIALGIACCRGTL